MKAKKHFGQHFLTSQTTAQEIVNGLGNIDDYNVLEIGPGMGILTQYLLTKAKHSKPLKLMMMQPNISKTNGKTSKLFKLIF